MTTKQVAEKYGLRVQTVNAAVRRGWLKPQIESSWRRRFDESEVESWRRRVESNRRKGGRYALGVRNGA